MIGATVWVLLSISTGIYNQGNISVIRDFHTEESCELFKRDLQELAIGKANLICVNERKNAEVKTKNARDLLVGDLMVLGGDTVEVFHITSRGDTLHINRKFRLGALDDVRYVD